MIMMIFNLQKKTAIKSCSSNKESSLFASTSSITSECRGDFRLIASVLIQSNVNKVIVNNLIEFDETENIFQ